MEFCFKYVELGDNMDNFQIRQTQMTGCET